MLALTSDDKDALVYSTGEELAGSTLALHTFSGAEVNTTLDGISLLKDESTAAEGMIIQSVGDESVGASNLMLDQTSLAGFEGELDDVGAGVFNTMTLATNNLNTAQFITNSSELEVADGSIIMHIPETQPGSGEQGQVQLEAVGNGEYMVTFLNGDMHHVVLNQESLF